MKMKILLVAVVVVTLSFTPAFAQRAEQHDENSKFLRAAEKADLLASDLMQIRIYLTADDRWEASAREQLEQEGEAAIPDRLDGEEMVVAAVPPEWEDAGDVTDVILTREGKVRGVLVDVGGIHGVGAQTIAIDWNSLQIVDRQDGALFYLLLTAARERLEKAPEYQEYRHTADRAQVQPSMEGTQGKDFIIQFGEWSDILASDLLNRTVYVTANDKWEATAMEGQKQERNARTSENHEPGAMVVTERPDDWEDAGEVADVIVTRAGGIRAVLVDVGGFLGIGARTIAIGWNHLQLVDRHDDAEFYLVLTTTRDRLEKAPEYRHDDIPRGYRRGFDRPVEDAGRNQTGVGS